MPNETLSQIFNELSAEDLFAVAAVCKQLNCLADCCSVVVQGLDQRCILLATPVQFYAIQHFRLLNTLTYPEFIHAHFDSNGEVASAEMTQLTRFFREIPPSIWESQPTPEASWVKEVRLTFAAPLTAATQALLMGINQTPCVTLSLCDYTTARYTSSRALVEWSPPAHSLLSLSIRGSAFFLFPYRLWTHQTMASLTSLRVYNADFSPADWKRHLFDLALPHLVDLAIEGKVKLSGFCKFLTNHSSLTSVRVGSKSSPGSGSGTDQARPWLPHVILLAAPPAYIIGLLDSNNMTSLRKVSTTLSITEFSINTTARALLAVAHCGTVEHLGIELQWGCSHGVIRQLAVACAILGVALPSVHSMRLEALDHNAKITSVCIVSFEST